MTDEELQAIKARNEARTPGRWVHPGGFVVHSGNSCVCQFADETWESINYPSDAEFVAHAATDIPALIEALEEARAENDRLKALINRCHDCGQPVDSTFCS